MERYIFFRSRYIRWLQSWDGHLLRVGRGTDYWDITEYMPGDDTRDISWAHSMRSTWANLKKKIRSEEDIFPILIINTIQESEQFSTKKSPVSVWEYAAKLVSHIEISAKKYHFPLKLVQALWDNRVRQHMILYITHDISSLWISAITWLCKYNDLIVIHLCHPYEQDPSGDLILEGSWVDIAAYTRSFQEQQRIFSKDLISHRWGYIMLNTEDNINASMNNFFKNRNK
jgi:hypothetical protein